MPVELVEWLQHVCADLGLLLVLWRVGTDANVVAPNGLQPLMLQGLSEDSIQLFVVSSAFSPEPVWRAVGERREVDFEASGAVQVVPSVIAPDGRSLLQGRIAVLRSEDYKDAQRAAHAADLFRELQKRLRQISDSTHQVVQRLPNGDKKVWRGMLLGRLVAGSGLLLKQFALGSVVFDIDSSD